MPPNLGGFFMVRSYYPSECHADYFDFERIEALKPAIEACGISTLSQSPMLGLHKQMDNRIKLLEEILSFRMQGGEFDNGDMYFDCHKADSDLHSFPTRRSSDLATQKTRRRRSSSICSTSVTSPRISRKIGRATSELQSLTNLVCRLLLEKKMTFRMQGVEFDNGDMYVDGTKAASDVCDEFGSVT